MLPPFKKFQNTSNFLQAILYEHKRTSLRKGSQRFEKENGSVFCREIIGYDLSVPEESEKALNSKVFDEKCVFIVKNAVKNLLEFVNEL